MISFTVRPFFEHASYQITRPANRRVRDGHNDLGNGADSGAGVARSVHRSGREGRYAQGFMHTGIVPTISDNRQYA